MRHFNLVEQDATYVDVDGAFVPTDAVPGRLNWDSISVESGERLNYLAVTSDGSAWEIGIGVWDGSQVNRVAVVKSTGSFSGPVSFTVPVRLSLIQPAGSMLVIDSQGADPGAAFGDGAMAAGEGARSWGDDSLAFGPATQVGSESSPVAQATAIGCNARVYHARATALGYNGFSYMPGAIHGRADLLWSGNGFTSGAEGNDIVNVTLPRVSTSSALVIQALVIARRDSSSDVYAAIVRGLLARGGSGDAVIVGTPSVVEVGKSGGVTVEASLVALTGGEFAIRGTGASGQDWTWSAGIHGVWV